MKFIKKLILIIVSSASMLCGGCGGNTSSSEYVSPDISLSEKKIQIAIGDTFLLKATTSETSLIVFWFVRDKAIATVSDKGLVTAISVGETVCYAQVGKNTAMCSIKVTPYEPSASLNVTSTSDTFTLCKNDVFTLPLKVTFGEEEINEYSSRCDISDQSVISVKDLKITALEIGVSSLLLTIVYQEVYADQLLLNIIVC